MNPFGYQPPQHPWSQNYYYQQPFQQPPTQKGGNFLQKLFSKKQYGNYSQPMFGYGYGSGSGMASKYANLHQTLNHVQKGLGLVKQITPYIKEYGPLVKNFPMFIDMMKIMMENDDEEESNENQIESQDERSQEEDRENDYKKKQNRQVKRKSASSDSSNELPSPKLYI